MGGKGLWQKNSVPGMQPQEGTLTAQRHGWPAHQDREATIGAGSLNLGSMLHSPSARSFEFKGTNPTYNHDSLSPQVSV